MPSSLLTHARLAVEQFGTCPACGGRALGPCRRCLEKALLLSFVDALPVVALGAHDKRLSESILRLKYADASHVAFPLGYLLGRLARGLSSLPLDAPGAHLVPIPLHPTRLVERGYNQSALIARGIAAALDVPLEFALLRRDRATNAQATLGERERLENTASAFGGSRSAPRACVLVDDVCTTGSTLRGAARALEAAGHRVVGAFTVSLSIRRASMATRLVERAAEEGRRGVLAPRNHDFSSSARGS